MKKKSIDVYLLYALVVLMLTGNVIALRNVEIMGVVISAYRVFIPGIAVFYACKRFYEKKLKNLFEDRIFIAYMVMFGIWIIWGSVLLFTSSYCNMIVGAKDLISLLLGMASIYCFYELCNNENMVEEVFHCIRVIYVIVCVLALFEILTGFYMPFSKYYYGDVIGNHEIKNYILSGLKSAKVYPATTIFFNVNDFSVFLSIFFPLFFIEYKDKKVTKFSKSIILFIVMLINAVNDANIVMMSIIFTLTLHVLFVKENKKIVGGIWAVFLALFLGVNKIICSLLITLKSNLPIKIENIDQNAEMDLISKSDFYNITEVLSAQLADVSNGGNGSLASRIQNTLISMEMTLETKFLGVGPGGFTNYIEKNVMDFELVNPHNWWLEILSQYGIIVFLLYFVITVLIFIKIYKLYLMKKNYKYLIICCMFSIFALSCIAPSNYLGYTYQWLLPALGICLLNFNSSYTRSE